MTIKTLRSMRCEEQFNLFWNKVVYLATTEQVDEPVLPRLRRAPTRLEVGSAPSVSIHNTPEDMYRQVYYEALDLILGSITERFDQDDYRVYIQCEELLLKAARGQDYQAEINHVTTFYGSDFNRAKLDAHLKTFHSSLVADGPLQQITLRDVISYLQSLTAGQQCLISSVVTLVKLLLVMPATNASSERSFSGLRRIKTYLRSTMTQKRLNHLMLMHVHKEKCDKLQLLDVANDFVQGSEHRLSLFGKFTALDLAKTTVAVRCKYTMTGDA